MFHLKWLISTELEYICMYVYMYILIYIIRMCVCVCVCTHHPLCVLGELPLAKRKAVNSRWGKAEERVFRRKGWGTPQTPEVQTCPSLFWEQCPLVTQKLRWLISPLIAHPLRVPLCSPLKEVLQTARQSPRGQKDWGKVYEGWRGNLQECPNGKATLNRMFS